MARNLILLNHYSEQSQNFSLEDEMPNGDNRSFCGNSRVRSSHFLSVFAKVPRNGGRMRDFRWTVCGRKMGGGRCSSCRTRLSVQIPCFQGICREYSSVEPKIRELRRGSRRHINYLARNSLNLEQGICTRISGNSSCCFRDHS